MAETVAVRDPDAVQRLFGQLLEIERRCLANASGLPQQRTLEVSWEGVLFSVGGGPMVAPLDEVREILNYPSAITAVPGTRAWVRGIANIRGSLLPVIDLQYFLFGHATTPGRRSRVLVIDHEGLFAGLLVDESVGIRHFQPRGRQDDTPGLAKGLRSYVSYSFKQGDRVWPVFSMRSLAGSADFQFAAA